MTPEIRTYTLVEQVSMSGTHGTYAAIGSLVLWLIGMVLIFTRPGMRIRSAYLITCLLPCAFGVLGFATSCMAAFVTLGASGIRDGLIFLRALGEVTMPMFFGFIGSGVAFMIASIVWLRSEKATAPATP